MTTLKRRMIRAGGWGVAKRLIKPIPIIGSVFAFGLAVAFPVGRVLASVAGFLILLPPLTSDLLPSCA